MCLTTKKVWTNDRTESLFYLTGGGDDAADSDDDDIDDA